MKNPWSPALPRTVVHAPPADPPAAARRSNAGGGNGSEHKQRSGEARATTFLAPFRQGTPKTGRGSCNVAFAFATLSPRRMQQRSGACHAPTVTVHIMCTTAVTRTQSPALAPRRRAGSSPRVPVRETTPHAGANIAGVGRAPLRVPPAAGSVVEPPAKAGTVVHPPPAGTVLHPPAAGRVVEPAATAGPVVHPLPAGTVVHPPAGGSVVESAATAGTVVHPPPAGTVVHPPAAGTVVDPSSAAGTVVYLPSSGKVLRLGACHAADPLAAPRRKIT